MEARPRIVRDVITGQVLPGVRDEEETVVIAGARDLSAVLGPVLITTAVGTVVFGVVAARARFRRRLEELEDGSPTPTTPQETDRG